MEDEIKVRRFKCLCGKSRMLSVIDADNPPSKQEKKEQSELVASGCDVDTITLDEARKEDLCFSCKL